MLDSLDAHAAPWLWRVFGTSAQLQGLRFRGGCRHADLVARRTLSRILRLNRTAEFTRARMGGSTSLARFRALPMTTYDDYAPAIERIANGGVNELTADPVTSFLLSAGTTGRPKLLPMTKRQSNVMRWHMLAPLGMAMREGTLGPVRARWLHLLTLYPGRTSPSGLPISSAPAQAVDRLRWVFERLWSSPLPVFRVSDQATARYLHFLFALAEPRLWCILSFYPSILLNGFRDLHARADEMLRDLSDGTLSSSLALSREQRAELTRQHGRHRERARQLSRLISAGRLTVDAIWPGIGPVLSAGSGGFAFYVDQLKPYLGDVGVFSPTYAASEGVVGIRASARDGGYTVSPLGAYVEFLPHGGRVRPDSMPRSLGEVEPGGIYEVVLTNYVGFLRYRLGDLVEVVGWRGQSPIVRFLERQGQNLDVCGEKVSETQVASAFDAACRQCDAALVDYIVTIDMVSNPPRYLLLVEWAKPGDIQLLLRTFDDQLRQTNTFYDKWRQVGMLSPLAAIVLEHGAFERFRDARIEQGVPAAQVKIAHVVPSPEFAARHFADATRIALSA